MLPVGPKVRTHQKQVSVRRSDRIVLRCEAEGDQPLNITWQAKGSRIDPTYDIRYHQKNSPMHNGVVSELTIMQTTLNDRGEYMCIGTNAYGQDHSVVFLQVQEPPNFPTNLHITELTSRSVTLSWAHDVPPIVSDRSTHYYPQPISNYILQFKEASDVWHDHNNQKLLPGDKLTAKITSLKPSVHYHFRLYAVNQLGTSAPSDVLHVHTEAEPPGGPPIMVTVEPLGPQQLLSKKNIKTNRHFKLIFVVLFNSQFNGGHLKGNYGTVNYWAIKLVIKKLAPASKTTRNRGSKTHSTILLVLV